MPANLPPQYFEAEKRLRLAKSPEEKIVVLEEMLAIMPKHKGTDHLRAELRTRIAKLNQLAAKKSGAHRASMAIEKEGAAQVAIIGPPNVGKSQLVASITNASPTIAEYPFTWLRHMLIRADALLVVVDLSDAPLSQLEDIIVQLGEMRIGLGKRKTEVEPEFVLYQKKGLIIGNKLDLDNTRQNYVALENKYKDQLPLIAISAKEGVGLEELRHEIYQMLNIIRVYTKAPGQKPDFTEPIVLERGSTLENAATEVHKDFAQKLRYARIWGSGKHNGVMAKRDHVLQDGDVIELHL